VCGARQVAESLFGEEIRMEGIQTTKGRIFFGEHWRRGLCREAMNSSKHFSCSTLNQKDYTTKDAMKYSFFNVALLLFFFFFLLLYLFIIWLCL